MPFFDHVTCEPLRIWDRLEPRARRVEFDEALQARVHDPLWLLGRQWQMGEFKGEDTGSAVLAKLARRLTPVAQVQVGDGAPELEDLSLPERRAWSACRSTSRRSPAPGSGAGS